MVVQMKKGVVKRGLRRIGLMEMVLPMKPVFAELVNSVLNVRHDNIKEKHVTQRPGNEVPGRDEGRVVVEED